MNDLRFPTALQMMLSLALAEREGAGALSSAKLAEGLGSHASLVRKLLIPLVRDGLVNSTEGKNGGVHLGRPAKKITLAEIYRSVTLDKRMWAPRSDIPHRCVVSSNVESFFERLTSDAEDAVLKTLKARTLAASLAGMDQAPHRG